MHFSDFQGLTKKDITTGVSERTRIGAFQSSDIILDELREFTATHDKNRSLGHIP